VLAGAVHHYYANDEVPMCPLADAVSLRTPHMRTRSSASSVVVHE